MCPIDVTNEAAWISGIGARLQVDKAPYPQADPGHIIIRNAAISISHIDWKVQDAGFYVRQWPAILGHATAGEVVEVGENVSNFEKGQRVLAHCLPFESGKAQEGAFQLYTTALAALSSPIPDSTSFAAASVFPLAISTAAAGLYQKHLLDLPLPTEHSDTTDNTILVWGGSSSVGSAAIQLASASGVNVIAIASRRNFDFVKALGAESVFDYTTSSLADDLIEAVDGRNLVGVFDSIGLPETTRFCAHVLSLFGGGTLASVNVPPEVLPYDVTAKKSNLPQAASMYMKLK